MGEMGAFFDGGQRLWISSAENRSLRAFFPHRVRVKGHETPGSCHSGTQISCGKRHKRARKPAGILFGGGSGRCARSVDAWHGIAERLALSAPKPPEPKPEARQPWWRRLRMTG
jgi:hypothetical protein